MQFAYTILYVDNVPDTLDFYEHAFGFKRRFLDDSQSFGELDTGNTRLSFCARALLQQMGKTVQKPNVKSPCSEIAFTVDDVPAAVERAVTAGATLLQAPEQMPWGQTVAYVADREGFWVELCTSMG